PLSDPVDLLAVHRPIARPQDAGVLARTSVQHVHLSIVRAGHEVIVPIPCEQTVLASPGPEVVVPRTAEDHVRASASLKGVVPTLAVDEVRPTGPVDVVVAVRPDEHVIAGSRAVRDGLAGERRDLHAERLRERPNPREGDRLRPGRLAQERAELLAVLDHDATGLVRLVLDLLKRLGDAALGMDDRDHRDDREERAHDDDQDHEEPDGCLLGTRELLVHQRPAVVSAPTFLVRHLSYPALAGSATPRSSR